MNFLKSIIFVIIVFQFSCSSNILGNKNLEYRFITDLINKDYNQAEKYLTKLEKVYPQMNKSQRCDYHFYKGCYFSSIKDFKKAEVELSSCIKINNAYVQALYARAKLYTHALENKKARKEDFQMLLSILKYLESNNTYENPTITLYSINPASSKYTTSIKKSDLEYRFVNVTLNLDELILETLGNLESIEFVDKNYYQAINYILEILQYPKASFEYNQKLGDCYFKLEQYKKAIENYTIYLSNPESAFIVHHRRGLCYFHLGYYEKALHDFNESLNETNNPEKPSSIAFLKKLKNDKDNKYFEFYNNNKLEINKRIELITETKTSVLFYQARCYEKLKQIDSAIASMSALLNFNSNYKLAYYYRGYYFNEKKEFHRAIEDFKKALEIDSELTQLYYSIAVNYDNLNNETSAKKYYNLYIKYHENKTSTKYKYALKRYNEL